MKAPFNKSQIFKAAWSLVKTAGKSLSEALRAAWAMAKQPKSIVDIAKEIINSDSYTVSLWEKGDKKRLYINAPYESRAYAKVGYIDLNTGRTFCEVHETRTSRGREYASLLNNIATAI
ncbi:hypothetical protein FVR03_01450 [Pontibacter qinzhouensis]|uniref:Uncharacterized protein n=1 Tax=Pontibacter qinzhouensis TaxID=2603253 RepID=A0A5C8KDB7_9BACT|nr:hypothetical protein [Pontibacter qinzhouensis]TXK52410.1 hypothetical protein FVR03_01450 [Pontibacter qinzhouensis]